MDANHFREKAETCLRQAKVLRWNNPDRFHLMDLAEDYQSDLLAQLPLKWMMQKAIAHGLSFRRNVDLDENPETSPICDSYAEFMDGWYKRATFNHPYFREIGQAAVPSGQQIVRTTINETIDVSVFDHWRADPTYRPQNLLDWSDKRHVDPSTLRSGVRADNPAANHNT